MGASPDFMGARQATSESMQATGECVDNKKWSMAGQGRPDEANEATKKTERWNGREDDHDLSLPPEPAGEVAGGPSGE